MFLPFFHVFCVAVKHQHQQSIHIGGLVSGQWVLLWRVRCSMDRTTVRFHYVCAHPEQTKEIQFTETDWASMELRIIPMGHIWHFSTACSVFSIFVNHKIRHVVISSGFLPQNWKRTLVDNNPNASIIVHLFDTECIANLISIFFSGNSFMVAGSITSRSRSICATYGSVPDLYCFIIAIATAATTPASNLSHVRHTNYCGMFLHLYFHILLAIDKNLSCARQVNRCTHR